jgi:eukaryotic-like serine/threonine-protein kinase
MTEKPSERDLLLSALSLPPEQQLAFLNDACKGDNRLRDRLLALIHNALAESAFMEKPAFAAEATPPLKSSYPGMRIGRYKLMEQIGEGGMGVVFVAEQAEPVRRTVALKLIKPGMDSIQVIARFEAERQALALMDHPNIARVLDAGATDAGLPYFVMELVRGLPITDYCDQAKLSPKSRLELFLSVCSAVQHAHLKGIIHRDIKPNNVLVTLHDGVPIVKVIDFGVAKALHMQLTQHTLYTALNQVMGTPMYMSPEQLELSGLDIDTRTDVYSLGVLLYELLTGVLPFSGEELCKAGLDELRRIIRERDPPRPSQRVSTFDEKTQSTNAIRRGLDQRSFSRTYRGELDWIVMKALEKDRNRRYESPGAMSMDLGRYLRDEPVEARPPTLSYRFGKLLRRNRIATALTALVILVAIVGPILATNYAVLLQREAQISSKLKLEGIAKQTALNNAKVATEELKHQLFRADVNLAYQEWHTGDVERAKELLARHKPSSGAGNYHGFAWHFLWQRCNDELLRLEGDEWRYLDAKYSPSGRWLAIDADRIDGDQSGIFVHDARTGTQVLKLNTAMRKNAKHTRTNGFLGSAIAFTNDDNTLAIRHLESLELVELPSGNTIAKRAAPFNNFRTIVAAATNAPILTTALEDRTVGVFDARTLEPRNSWATDEIQDLRLSDSGEFTVVRNHWEGITICMTATGEQKTKLQSKYASSYAVDIRGELLAYELENRYIKLWDMNTNSEKEVAIDAGKVIRGLYFMPNTEQIATISRDCILRSYDIISGRLVGELRGPTSTTNIIAFAKDSTSWTMLENRSADKSGKVVIRPGISRTYQRIKVHDGGIQLNALPNSRRFASRCTEDKTIKLWSIEPFEEVTTVTIPKFNGNEWAVSADGRLAAFVNSDGLIHLFRGDNWADRTQLDCGPHVSSLAISPDGSLIAAGCHADDGFIGIWDSTSLKQVAKLPGQGRIQAGDKGKILPGVTVVRAPASGLRFLPDGEQIAVLVNQEERLYDVRTGNPRQVIQVPQNAPSTIDFLFKNTFRVIAERKNVCIWDIATRQCVARIDISAQNRGRLALSHDGKTMASVAADGTIRLWSVPLQQAVGVLRECEESISSLMFTDDSKTLIAGDYKGNLHIWRASLDAN